jgi:hypothetical protein
LEDRDFLIIPAFVWTKDSVSIELSGGILRMINKRPIAHAIYCRICLRGIWDKINLVPDTAAPAASRKYTGFLTAGYSNGVLTIKGVLTLL